MKSRSSKSRAATFTIRVSTLAKRPRKIALRVSAPSDAEARVRVSEILDDRGVDGYRIESVERQ